MTYGFSITDRANTQIQLDGIADVLERLDLPLLSGGLCACCDNVELAFSDSNLLQGVLDVLAEHSKDRNARPLPLGPSRGTDRWTYALIPHSAACCDQFPL